MEKAIKKYSEIYKKVLSAAGIENSGQNIDAYKKRLGEMYSSDNFRKHNIYPTTNATNIYAVIAMCLELKKFGMADNQIIDAVDKGFSARRNFFKRLIRLIDKLPNSYQIAKKWNLSDHEKRVKDGSIVYDYFNVSDEKIEYCISKCMYVEMFETYALYLSGQLCVPGILYQGLYTGELRRADWRQGYSLHGVDNVHLFLHPAPAVSVLLHDRSTDPVRRDGVSL